MKRLLCAAAISLLAPPALAGDQATTYPYDGSFDDATFAVESAIVGRGLVIDLQSHVGEMLNRTGADVGSDVMIFDAADIFLFCSATLSREVMVADQGGKVLIGYRNYPDGEMQKVQAMLDDIVQEALQ